jgi:hypothetical protein
MTMDVETFKEYITLVNDGYMKEASDKYYAPEMYLLDDGHHYDKKRIMELIPLIQAQMKLCYNLIGYYYKSEGDVLAVEIEVEHVALQDVEREPFEKAGMLEAYLPLKKGEVSKSLHFYKYTFEGKMFTSSIGYTKNGAGLF